MTNVRLQHPNLDQTIEVPESAVGHLAMSGWVPAEGEPPPTCPTCGSVWPAYAEQPEPGDKSDEAPAESGASESEGTAQPKRRRSSKSEESE